MLGVIFGRQDPVGGILRDYGAVLVVAFLVGLAATPVCRRLALRFGVVDYPDNGVKTHTEPTAYLGGMGIWAGMLAGVVLGICMLKYWPHESAESLGPMKAGFTGRYPDWLILAGIALGATMACALGVLDDIVDLMPGYKLLGQAAAAVVLVAVGIRPNLEAVYTFLHVEPSAFWDIIITLPIVLFFILGATNSLNLLDGLDGLCAGVTAIITVAFALLALTLATWRYSPVGDPVRLILCLALAGGTLGFLPMNRHPARIFMGDGGSMLLGFVAGALMLLFAETMGRWTVAAVIIFGLPILDTAVALVRRLLNKKPLFVSDRGHIYDQFMDRGMSLRQSVKLCYVLAGLYAVVGLVVSQIRFRYAAVFFFVLVIISGYVMAHGGFLRMSESKKDCECSDNLG